MEQKIKEIVKKLFDIIEQDRVVGYEDKLGNLKHVYNCIMTHTTFVVEQDRSLSFTPIEGNFPYIDEICEYVKNSIPSEQINPNEEFINLIANYLKVKAKQEVEVLKSYKINDYYGSVDYIKERTNAIVNAIGILYNDPRTTKEELNIIKSYSSDIESILKSINSYSETKQSYINDVSKPFARLLSYEKELTKITEKRWKEYFEEKNASLIHFLSDIPVKSDDMDKICTSLYTEDLKDRVCTYGHTGYLYDFDYNHVKALGSEDLGSWRFTRDEFLGIEEEFKDETVLPMLLSCRQFSNENECFFETGNHTLLYLPETIEKEALNSNVSYTEIYINNRKNKLKPKACFYTEDATLEEIEIIKKLAEEQNLIVEALPINKEEKRR